MGNVFRRCRHWKLCYNRGRETERPPAYLDKKASPMQIAYDIMQLDTHPKQTVIMGASSKDAGRFKGTAEKYVPKR
jgi:hypothetical protein